ncbi:alkene reductase [Aliarcobacter cryaerophilus]|uniref:Alkene reductase n=1 Tax=Aliarcobacter cryaerophilus TaxID=28198 RepID=A0A2S9SLV5_9BACT|nr:alkene reductase [Aliarcobacter cryaerophilus]PRM87559.1 alkene reductase [Aliarcobacter cryaerophilus]
MNLFSEIKIGQNILKNRIIMAPMTRCRAVINNSANDLIAEYYSQRASAGLIIAEASQVSSIGTGYPCTPGIYSKEQIEGWSKVTKAVHDKGGLIFLQIWHTGRSSHPSLIGGETPVAPSAIKIDGQLYTYEGLAEFPTPRALEISEIKEIVNQFEQAAKNAIEAGFDGVEIHGANGYLIDEFLKDGSNKREDEYGGSIENRSKFLFEIIEAVSNSIGNDKTALRLSPCGTFNGMSDSNPKKHFSYICEKLNDYDLAYLHIMNPLEGDIRHGGVDIKLDVFRKVYQGTLVGNGGYTKESGNKAIEENIADAISFGAIYTSNPDLVERFKVDAPLTQSDPNTFYTQDEKGFTDYKFIN